MKIPHLQGAPDSTADGQLATLPGRRTETLRRVGGSDLLLPQGVQLHLSRLFGTIYGAGFIMSLLVSSTPSMS